MKVLAECQARISQHEFQAARAKEEERLLQGQLWQQKLEFREAHQRSLTEMGGLRKFQSSAFDTVARRKFIEQNTILELSGRVQELKNEVNCKVTLIFLEYQKGLFHNLTTRFRMPVKQLMTSGPRQETSFAAITLNQESNFTRREKNHSLFH